MPGARPTLVADAGGARANANSMVAVSPVKTRRIR
jgi:hypothetical protein